MRKTRLSTRRGGLLAFVTLLLGVATARADPAAERAEDVHAAAASGDQGLLAQLAARDDPDPWLVADRLLANDRKDSALVFAALTSPPIRDPLLRWLEHAHEPPGADATRQVLQEVEGLLEDGAPQTARAQLETLAPSGAAVVDVCVEHVRGRVLEALDDPAGAAHAYVDAATEAEGLGWLTLASDALYRASLARDARAELSALLPLHERRLDLERRLGSRIGMGRASFGLATAYLQLGRLAEAREHRALALSYAESSGDDEYVLKVIYDVAVDLAWQDDPSGAYAALQRGIRMLPGLETTRVPARFRASRTRQRRLAANLLLNAASVASRLGRLDEAHDHGQRALESARESGDGRLVTQVQAFLAVVDGVLCERAGDDLAALTEYERARDLYASGGDRLQIADTMRRIAQAQSRIGDLPAALEIALAALEILRDVGQPRALAHGLLEAGGAAQRVGRLDEAEGWLDEELELAERLDDVELQAHGLIQIAGIHQARGHLGRALQLLDRARALPYRDDAGGILGVIDFREGGLRDAMGEHDKGSALLARAARRLEKAGDEDTLALVHRVRARLLAQDGARDEARGVLETALRRARERDARPAIAESLTGLADLAFVEGEYEKAIEHRTEALRLYREIGDFRMSVSARAQRGRELFWSGDRDGGVEELLAARHRAETSGMTGVRAWTAVGLCEAYSAMGDDLAAIGWAEKGLDDVEDYGLDLAETEAAFARSEYALFHLVGAESALRTHDLPRLFRFLERGQASTLLTALDGASALRSAHVPAALRREEEAARADAAVARQRLLLAERRGLRREVGQARAELESAQEHLREALRAIRSAVRLQTDLAYAVVPALSEVVASLRPEEVLVLYARVDEDLVGLVVSPRDARAVVLGRADDAEALFASWFDGDGGVDRAATAKARELLVDRLRLPASAERLLVCPSGLLAQLPFGLLVQGRSVSVLPSAAVLCALRSQPSARGERVLALGDPDYGPAGGSLAVLPSRRGGARLAALPASGVEARSVGDVVLLGPEASESGLLNVLPQARRWRAVHFACHGLLDPDHPGNSALALSLDAANDGLLEAREVFGLSVPTDLVVLSGCETGRGTVIQGEGLLGLTRAFMSAGAPRVLCSLWKVDDDATRALMVRFYQLWNPRRESGGEPVEGLGAAEALRQAQAFVRGHEAWSDPRYWAAWVLWGLPE